MAIAKPVWPVLQPDEFDLTQGLVAAYPLFENLGNSVADLGGSSNRASLTASPWVGSPFGAALSFNGSTSTLQSNAVFPAIDIGDFSVAVLFCPTSMPGSYIALFDNVNRDPAAFFNAGGGAATWFLAYASQSVDAVGSITIAVNNWYRFLWTHSGSLSTIYINGLVSGTASAPGTPLQSTALLQIGLNPSGGGQKFAGYVAETRTYNRGLSASEAVQDALDPFSIYRRRAQPQGNIFVPPALAPRGWFDAELIGSKAWFG